MKIKFVLVNTDKGIDVETIIRDKLREKSKSGPYELKRMFNLVDLNGSGYISYPEFKEALKNFGLLDVSLLDANFFVLN